MSRDPLYGADSHRLAAHDVVLLTYVAPEALQSMSSLRQTSIGGRSESSPALDAERDCSSDIHQRCTAPGLVLRSCRSCSVRLLYSSRRKVPADPRSFGRPAACRSTGSGFAAAHGKSPLDADRTERCRLSAPTYGLQISAPRGSRTSALARRSAREAMPRHRIRHVGYDVRLRR